MTAATHILALIVMITADRIRGDKPDMLGLGHFDVPTIGRLGDKLIYGWAVAVLLGHPADLVGIAIVLGMVAGMSPGWGTPLSALLNDRPMRGEFEWWQFGPLKESALAAMAFRGAMWAACLIPAALMDPAVWAAVVGYLIAVPLAPRLTDSNPLAERLRALFAGLIIMTFMVVA